MLVVALLVGMLVALGAFAPVAAAARVPKVALIVGPVGDTITARYKALANEAATVARNAGAEVVKVYSPNATWPAVRDAISGASIVIYLGHGNGWPSRYRDSLFPTSQNGFGLNPVAGGDNSAHQYFGEASVDNVKLARNAVVLLHHLCYASGNTEPGLAEGSVDQAVQRVDNYAAGFIRAGAAAVVAEGHLGPAWYVRQLLTGRGSIESIWNRSPNANGNTFKTQSVRSKGFVSRLDPDNRSSGFYRSLVSRGGTTASDIKSGALGRTSPGVGLPPAEPSLANLSLRFGELTLATAPVAATRTRLTLPLPSGSADRIPKGAQVGLRWDPILLDPSVEPEVTVSPDPAASPGPGASPDPGSSPAASATPTASTAAHGLFTLPADVVVDPAIPTDAPAVDLVVPEQAGKVVTLAPAKRRDTGLVVKAEYPDAPGLYRLVPTLHTPSGEAYDAATQQLLTPVLVRVAGPVAAAYGTPAGIVVVAGMDAVVPIRVLDVGVRPWEQDAVGLVSRWPAHLVAMWTAPSEDLAVPPPASALLSPEAVRTAAGQVVQLAIRAPVVPGDYLLVLDVVSPAHGSLAALGGAPAFVRVTVTAANGQ